MSQDRQIVNQHAEKYLDYYCGLSHAPGYAVLLKGQWGVGKTWFVEKYREKHESQKEVLVIAQLRGNKDSRGSKAARID
jgi:tRNA A37 threonylcarbamoyladenosine biosynthesis protein TsaE